VGDDALWPIDEIPEIVLGDLDPEFIKSFAIRLHWEYDLLYESLVAHSGLPGAVLDEEFCTRKGGCAIKALVTASQKHGVPYEFKRLECNGQRKILAKAGRVVLIQESIRTLTDHPRIADYKQELAESHGILRQLERDLGDMGGRILDWSGCILGVLLHGVAGPWVTREHKALGNLLLGIPDTNYNHWIYRFDLLQIARFGREMPIEDPPTEQPTQEDRVEVTPKRKNTKKGADK